MALKFSDTDISETYIKAEEFLRNIRGSSDPQTQKLYSLFAEVLDHWLVAGSKAGFSETKLRYIYEISGESQDSSAETEPPEKKLKLIHATVEQTLQDLKDLKSDA